MATLRARSPGCVSALLATSPSATSGESGAAASLLAGADAFYSGVAGVLPEPMLKLAEAASAGRVEEAEELDRALKPLWALCRSHGTLRVNFAIADRLGLKVGDPPAPVRRLEGGGS